MVGGANAADGGGGGRETGQPAEHHGSRAARAHHTRALDHSALWMRLAAW